jgi:autotransporter-associated beta strand protein
VTFSGSGQTVVRGAVTQNGANPLTLLKMGSGKLTLSGNDTYTGGTLVTGGTLQVNSPGSLISPVEVYASGMFGGNGTAGSVTVNLDGHLAPGDGIGTLSLTGDLALAGGARLDFELGATTASDLIAMPGKTLTLNGQDFSTISILPQSGFGPGTYVLIDTGNLAGTGLGPNVSTTINGLPATLSVDSVNKDLVLTVVPEPSTLALLGVGALGLLACAWRRRRPA